MRYLWLLTGILSAGALTAQGLVPEAYMGPTSMSLKLGEQSLACDLRNATLTFRSPAGEVTLTPSLQQGSGWTQPGQLIDSRVVRGANRLRVELTYPVSDRREFEVVMDAWRDLPLMFVTSRLRLTSGRRAQYYYWQSSVTSDHYFAAGEREPARVNFHTDQWDTMPWRDWWFVPREKTGLVIVPSNDAGRAQGPEGRIFLHALPKSALLGPRDTLDATFGLGEARDPVAAAAAVEQAHRLPIPTLEAWKVRSDPQDYGPAAPRWLREAEVYGLYYRPAAQWTTANVAKLKPFPFVIGSTPDKAALDRCHQQGTKLLHYVVYTCLLDTARQVKEGGQVYSEWSESLDNESRDLKDHPDWVCVNEDGKAQQDAWGQAHGHPGLLNTCLHQPGLQEAAVRQVKLLMERGFDGVFIDLAGPVPECYGAKYDAHTHPNEGWSNTQAYQALLRKIHATVKSFGEDRVVIQNTCTSLLHDQWAYCDGQMLEAFPYGEGSLALRPTWPEMMWTASSHAEAVRRGKVPLLLSYFGGTAEQVRGPALLSYAYSHLARFLWGETLGLAAIKGAEPLASALYATRLGRAKSSLEQAGRVWYRIFEQGLVAANPCPWPLEVNLPATAGAVYQEPGGASHRAAGEVLTLRLEPGAATVLVKQP